MTDYEKDRLVNRTAKILQALNPKGTPSEIADLYDEIFSRVENLYINKKYSGEYLQDDGSKE